MGTALGVKPNFTHGAFAEYSKLLCVPLKSRYRFKHMAKSTSPPSHASTGSPELPATYEAALQELEGLISRLESGQLPLDQLLTGYQRGAQLLAFCKTKLESVETQIKVLEGTELKPWAK